MISPEMTSDIEPISPKPRRRKLWIGGGVFLLAVAGLLGLMVWAGSASCENLVRKRIAAQIESSTGGRVEIATFHWHPFSLEAEAAGIVIHGSEAPDQEPYARIGKVRVGISVFGFFSPHVQLRHLEIQEPAVHLIIYPDGTTNQPKPHRPGATSRSELDPIFALEASHVAVEQGFIHVENRSANFDVQNRHLRLDFAANDVSSLIMYLPAAGRAQEAYRIQLGARDITVARGDPAKPVSAPVHGYAQATVDLLRNGVLVQSCRLTSGGRNSAEHSLDVSGSLLNFVRPQWQASVKGDLDMRLLEPTTGYPNSPEGVARLNLTAQGHDGQFRVDGLVHADNGSYLTDQIHARSVTLDAKVHADPERLLITSAVARLHQGGRLEGSVALEHWLPELPGSTVIEAASSPAPTTHRWHFGRRQTAPTTPPAKPVAPPAPASMNGKVIAQLKDVSIDTVLDIVSERPFQRLGIDARVNGPATATWSHGDTKTLAVAANLHLSPSPKPVAGEASASGTIDGTYTQRDGAVDLRALNLLLPASQVEAHGHLGAYPVSSPSSLAVSLRSRDVREFDTVIRDLGLQRRGKTGVAALPGTLGGEAEFAGTWTGSLTDPHLSGNLKASNVSVELPTDSKDSAAQLRLLHLDNVEATGSYSASRIEIERSQLTHDNAVINMEGSLIASPSPSRKSSVPVFDANSQLSLTANAKNVDGHELESFVGRSLPFTGALSGEVTARGAIRTLDGSGWVQLDHGTLYGEPVMQARARGKVAGHEVQVSSLELQSEGGTVSAAGTFDMQSNHFQVSAHTPQLDLSKIDRIRSAGLEATGKLSFTLSGSGTADDPHLQAQGTISELAIRGEPFGDVQIAAHTANRTLLYDLSTHFQSASLVAHGETRLDTERTTHATLNFSQFNIEGLLKTAQVPGLTGQSSLAGTVTIGGPLVHPDQMRGDARLQTLAVTVAGVHLASEGPVHAALENAQITLDPVHITGEDTDMRAQGTLDLHGNRQLNFASSGSVNLKLAETLDPDLTASGVTTFQVEARGPLNNPGLRGRVDFQNASLALEDLPNSLSQLHGTLEFNQNRLEVRSLTAMTGGGQLSVSGYLAYQHGIFADLAVSGKGVRIRYPQGVSSLADANLKLQGPQNNLLLSGNVMLTRFSISSDLDIAGLAAQAGKVQPVAAPDAPSNHIRLDVRILSSPQLNFQNAYAKLAGDVDLRLRGTLATPSLLGRVSITEGNATIAGTRYELQRGDITFTNPVRIEPAIDLNATARVEDYDITLGLHGSLSKMTVSYRSDPPLPEADVVALLALGRTENAQQIYGQQQRQAAANPTTEALLGGALNATVSSRVQKLFGAGAVKVDPNYLGVLGNSTTRITVEEQLSKYVTLTYATDVNTTAQQLLQAEIAINRHVSLLVARDESGVFSMVVKAVRRYR